MQGSNRSGLQCYQHPNEEITNYCLHFDCLRPLCPDCVEIHTKQHQKQEIESWKHCVNKSARNVKSTLDTLKGIYQDNSKYRGYKSVDMIEAENVKKLNLIKSRILKIVDQAFDAQEQRLRSIIRSHYKLDPPDTTKLRMAIDQLEKILMKLGHSTSVLPAVKKSLLLDHSSLLTYFGDMKNAERKAPLSEVYIQQNFDYYPKLKHFLESSTTIGSVNNQGGLIKAQIQENIHYRSPNQNKYDPVQSSGRQSYSPFEPLRVTEPEYFLPDCKFKFLHFFIPASKQLKILHIDDVTETRKWKSVIFKAKTQLPCYFSSIITPNGQLYLTGGSEQDRRCRQIYRYDHQKNSLDFVCNMINDRSSHAICFLNNSIYIIGGFTKKDGQVSRECQVFRIDSRKCQAVAPLNTPSANSCATAYGNQFIFRFGGVENKLEGNSLVEMYSVTNNRWIVIDVETPRNIPRLELLSFSAAIQINQKQIFVFGGYNDSEMQKPERICYALHVNESRAIVTVKNYNTTPLTYAQGFWNNNPIIHKKKIFALQNITDQQDQLTAIADERRVVVFNGDRWL